MKKSGLRKIVLISVILSLCGCQSREIIGNNPTANAASKVGTSEADNSLEQTEEFQIVLTQAYKEILSEQLAEKWLDKWQEISEEKEMIQARASIFSAEMADGSFLTVIVYPTYKTNAAVIYRLSDSGIIEYGEYNCGWQFELLENDSGDYLHIITQYSGSAVGASDGNTEIDDEYFKVSESQIEPVLHIGRQEFDGEIVHRFVYDSDYNASDLSAEEYEELIDQYLEDCQVVYSVNLDMDGDYKNDVYYSFEDDAEQLEAAILASLENRE